MINISVFLNNFKSQFVVLGTYTVMSTHPQRRDLNRSQAVTQTDTHSGTIDTSSAKYTLGNGERSECLFIYFF